MVERRWRNAKRWSRMSTPFLSAVIMQRWVSFVALSLIATLCSLPATILALSFNVKVKIELVNFLDGENVFNTNAT